MFTKILDGFSAEARILVDVMYLAMKAKKLQYTKIMNIWINNRINRSASNPWSVDSVTGGSPLCNSINPMIEDFFLRCLISKPECLYKQDQPKHGCLGMLCVLDWIFCDVGNHLKGACTEGRSVTLTYTRYELAKQKQFSLEGCRLKERQQWQNSVSPQQTCPSRGIETCQPNLCQRKQRCPVKGQLYIMFVWAGAKMRSHIKSLLVWYQHQYTACHPASKPAVI